LPTTATPTNVLATVPPLLSAASENAAATSVEMSAAGGDGRPCTANPSDTVLTLATGASFTAVTYTGSTCSVDENAVMPPVASITHRPPAVPLVVSHARNVSALDSTPFQLASGR